MKNIFKRQDNTSTWIAAGIAGALAIGAVAFLYFRKRENESDDEHYSDNVADYLQVRLPKKHKKRTDLTELEDLVAHN